MQIPSFLTGLNWQAVALKLAIAVIALGAAAGVGFHFGEASVVKPLVTATVNATSQGAKAQSAKTAADAKENQTDSKARLDADTKRAAAVAAIKNSPSLLPTNPQGPSAVICPVISAEAMDKLNDPDIIGKDAQ